MYSTVSNDVDEVHDKISSDVNYVDTFQAL